MTRLEQLRLDAALTPEQLGELAGVSGRTVRRIEAGKDGRVESLKKLAAYFDVPASDLVREALPIRDRSAA